VAFTWAMRPAGRPAARLRRLAVAALRRLGVTEGEVGVLVCDDATIRALNRDFRHKDAATDVLSFAGGGSEPGERAYLGDIAISLETAGRQAVAAGVPVERELETLLLHALIHLMGYDHETDGGEMNALERRLRGELLG
jgi:probable rRNA maturation factor